MRFFVRSLFNELVEIFQAFDLSDSKKLFLNFYFFLFFYLFFAKSVINFPPRLRFEICPIAIFRIISRV